VCTTVGEPVGRRVFRAADVPVASHAGVPSAPGGREVLVVLR
jgi:hypothetical protein